MSKIIYYPYINVPASGWLNQMLLYWDEVLTIVPRDVIANPTRLDEHTLLLVQEGLVRQVDPSYVVQAVPSFVPDFQKRMARLGDAELEARRLRLSESSMPLHGDKMGELVRFLTDARLAKRDDYARVWYHVENRTAQEFMGYLASSLASQEDDTIPMTDDPAFLSQLASGSFTDSDADAGLGTARLSLLRELMPVPERPVSVTALATLKSEHGRELAAFRRTVEAELIKILSIPDSGHRERYRGLVVAQLKDQVVELSDYVRQTTGTRAKLVDVMCGIAEFLEGPVSKIASVMKEDFGSGAALPKVSPMLWAAYARVKLKLFDLEPEAGMSSHPRYEPSARYR